MPRRATDLNLLELQSNESHMRRALKRNATKREMSAATAREVERITSLIDRAMRDCAAGPTIGKARKKNPAYEQLKTLIILRELLLRNHKQPEPEKRGTKSNESFREFMMSGGRDERAM